MNKYNRNFTKEFHMFLVLYPIRNLISDIKKARDFSLAIVSFILFVVYSIFLIAILSVYHCAYVVQNNYLHFSLRNKFTDTHTVYSIPIISEKIIVINPDNSIQIASPSK